MTRRKVKKNKNESQVKGEKGISRLKETLSIIGILIGIFLLYRTIVLINFNTDNSAVSEGILSKNSSLINTLFVFEKEDKITGMKIIIYSQNQQEILEIDIPTQIYVTEDSADSFPVSSIKSVGEFLEYGSSKEYTVEYMGDLLGLKFDNYVWLADSSENTDEFFSKLSVWSILFDFGYSRELKDNLYSNLPILNLIKETNFINQMFINYQSTQMDILDCCIEQVIVSSEHTETRFDISSFDDEFSKYIDDLVSGKVEKERVNVEVYNASNISGLASKYARKIRHTGCRILRYDNASSMYENSVIYIPEPEEYTGSLDLVRDVVGEDIEVRYERPSFITTGDIVLVLGTDLAE